MRPWHVRNDGAGALRIRVMHTCASYPVDCEGLTLLPGESTDLGIKVWANYNESTGERTVSVTLLTNDRLNDKMRLTARFAVLCAMRLSSSRLRLESHSGVDDPDSTVTVSRADAAEVKPRVLGVELPWAGDSGDKSVRWRRAVDSCVRATLREVIPNEQYAVRLEVQRPWPAEGVSGRVRIATGVAEDPERVLYFDLVGHPAGQ